MIITQTYGHESVTVSLSGAADSRHVDKAIPAFREAIALKPDDEDTYRSLDYYSSKLDDFARAIEIYEQAIKDDPDNALAQESLGKAYFATHSYWKAAERYQQAIRLQPDNGMAHYELASAYLMLGDKDSALAEQKSLQDLVTRTDDYVLKRSYRFRADELLKKIQELSCNVFLRRVQAHQTR